jgi:integrase
VRQRIEAILDFATVREYRSGPNPAQWKSNLEHALPKKTAVRKVEHHPALPYREIAGFVADLRQRNSTTARLLEFVILTAVRSGEARAARWDEIDMREKVWTIPGGKMKSGREHRVPLSPAALAVLEKQAAVRSSDYIFPGNNGDAPMATSALPQFLRWLKRTDITTHGMRSCFRDWCGEQTSFPREIAEQALAHSVGDATEQAYRRGDALEKRRQLMTAWARYCETPAPAGEVVAFGAR